MRAEHKATSGDLAPGQAQALQQHLEIQLGLDFSGSRQRNLQAGLAALGEDLGAPLDVCAAKLTDVDWPPQLQAQCARHFTVAETYFFREARAFELLTDYARERFANTASQARLRVWSAGCCSGEECYSAAIALQRALPAWALARCSVLGTDINTEALAQAASAVYGRRSFRGAEAGALHFESAGPDLLRVSAPARDLVSFAEHNLACPDWPLYLQGMDIILCRNVLMYFSPRQARLCIARMRDCLVEGGWLVVSPSEATPELFAGFEVERHPDAIWFRKSSRQSSAHVAPARAMAKSMASAVPQARPSARWRKSAARATASPPSQDDERERAQDYCGLALAAAEAGREPEAAEHLRRALYLDPDCILATWLLGMLLDRQGHSHAARLQFDAAVQQLERLPREALVPGSDGMRADALREAVRALLARLETHKLVA